MIPSSAQPSMLCLFLNDFFSLLLLVKCPWTTLWKPKTSMIGYTSIHFNVHIWNFPLNFFQIPCSSLNTLRYSLKHPWNFLEIPLKLPLNTLETPLTLPWNYCGTSFELLSNTLETHLKVILTHPSFFHETPLKLPWNFLKATIKLTWNILETILKHP